MQDIFVIYLMMNAYGQKNDKLFGHVNEDLIIQEDMRLHLVTNLYFIGVTVIKEHSII